MTTILIREDSRDIHGHQIYGDTGLGDISQEFDFDAGLLNEIEKPGEVCCTQIAGTSVATDQTKKIYDYEDAFILTPHSSSGADPRDALGVMCKQGLLIKGTLERDMQWNGYYRSDTGQYNCFDNLIVRMWYGKSSTTAATWWYQEFSNTPAGGIMPMPSISPVSGHDYKISGVKLIDGVPHLIVKPWLGYVMYMPRETANWLFAKWGNNAYIPLNKNGVMPEITNKGLNFTVSDVYKNLYLKIFQWLLSFKA